MAEVARKYNLSHFEDSKARVLNSNDFYVVKGKSEKKQIWEQRVEILSILVPRILMITLALLTIIGSLMLKATLTETTARVRNAQNELNEAVNINHYLANEYNQAVNFTQVEERAVSLGLQKAAPGQVIFMDTVGEKNAIVYTYKTPLQEFTENIKNTVNDICNRLDLVPIF